MIIGIDATEANKKNRTGTEWYAYHLIYQLFHLLDEKDTLRLYLDSDLQEDFGDLPPNVVLRKLRWPLTSFWTQFRLSLEMIMDAPDVLFVPAHTLPLFRAKITLTTLHDVGFERFPDLYKTTPVGIKNPFIATVIDLILRIFSRGTYRNNEYDYHRFSARFAVKKATHIFTVSEFSKKEIQHFYHVPDDKISVIYHGYDHDLYKPVDDTDRMKRVCKKYHITKPFVYYIGRLEKKKNILALIQGFHQYIQKDITHHKLLLIGQTGYGWEEARRYIEKHHLWDHIIHPGYVDERDLPALYTAADAFLFLSHYEGFGLPLLHAMACGVPILAASAASIPEIGGDAALYVNQYSIDAITNSLERILTDQQLRNDLRSKGLARAQTFTWKKTSEKTYKIIKDIVDTHTKKVV